MSDDATRKGRYEEVVVPVLEESLHVDAVRVPTGGVRILKQIISEDHEIQQELEREHVHVERVPCDRIVDGPLPVVRTEDRIVIPIVEEVLVVEKRWVLKEEIHILRTRETVEHREVVTLHRQQATVERFPAPDDPRS